MCILFHWHHSTCKMRLWNRQYREEVSVNKSTAVVMMWPVHVIQNILDLVTLSPLSTAYKESNLAHVLTFTLRNDGHTVLNSTNMCNSFLPINPTRWLASIHQHSLATTFTGKKCSCSRNEGIVTNIYSDLTSFLSLLVSLSTVVRAGIPA